MSSSEIAAVDAADAAAAVTAELEVTVEPRAAVEDAEQPLWLQTVEAATAAGIVWVKTKGSPWWPAQLLSAAGEAAWAPRVPLSRAAGDLKLVQFFGTSEFAWARPDEIESWQTGLAQQRERVPRVRTAVTQAAGLAADSRAWPVGWWSLPPGETPNPLLPPSLKRKRPATQVGAPAAGSGSEPQYVKLRRNEWAPGLKQPKPRTMEESCVCQCTPSENAGGGHSAPAVPKGKAGAALRTGCGRGCLNRSMCTFCDPRTCPCKDLCSNRPFHQLVMPRTRAFQTPNGRGWGLAAAEVIRAGTFVVEYMGEILNDAMCEQRLWADKARGETNFYMMEVTRNQVIDARIKGNTSRLINSSCRPNCETQRWVDGASGETRVGIFALRDVQPGEELTYDYCFTHFGDGDATSFRCLCGAPDCRGTLDANPQRGLNRGRRIEVLWDDGIFYAATVASFNANTGKFRLVYDDGDVEVIRLEADPDKRQPDDVVFRWLPQDEAGAKVAEGDKEEALQEEVGAHKHDQGTDAEASPAETAPASEAELHVCAPDALDD